MKKTLFFGVLALQVCVVPAIAGDWPEGGGEKFIKECVAGAAGQVPHEKAVAYCQCSSGMMQEAFTSEQLATVTQGARKPTEDEMSVLTDISRSCARETLQ